MIADTYLFIRAFFLISHYRRLIIENSAWAEILNTTRMLKSDKSSTDIKKAEKIIKITRQAGALHRDLKNPCLVLSLAAYHLHQKNWLESKLCIGVKKYPFFYSHAWIESNGAPLMENREFISELSKLVEV